MYTPPQYRIFRLLRMKILSGGAAVTEYRITKDQLVYLQTISKATSLITSDNFRFSWIAYLQKIEKMGISVHIVILHTAF